jgi:hypothetical protein
MGMSNSWDYLWDDWEEEDVTQPHGSQIEFCYWWEDMRPREVLELVKRAYEAGYQRGQSE